MAQLHRKRISHNAFWMFASQGGNFALQAATFVLLARFLGVREYGTFAGCLALITTVSPYSTLGSGMLFMRYVSADEAGAPTYWGNSLAITAGMSIVLAALLSYIGPLITGTHSVLLFFSLALANCLFAQVVGLAGSVFQTFENMQPAAILNLTANGARLLVLLGMQVIFRRTTAVWWCVGVLISSFGTALVSVAWVWLTIGRPRLDTGLLWSRAKEGFGFSFAGTTQSVYNDIDKTMLNHYGFVRENGAYTVAYRLADFATAPILALEAATLPRYFQLSEQRLHGVGRFALRMVCIGLLLGGISLAAMLFLMPFVPRLFGPQFSQVVLALQWLCWLPLLRSVHVLTGSALTGTGRQNLRTAAQLSAAGVNIVLNIWWISRFGWMGAAWSSVVCDGLLAVLNATMLCWLCWNRFGPHSLPVITSQSAEPVMAGMRSTGIAHSSHPAEIPAPQPAGAAALGCSTASRSYPSRRGSSE